MGSAAEAFDGLRAEVYVLRCSIESLPAAWQASQAPDYTPTPGAISKRMQEVATRLQAIEGHPALRMTPVQHEQAIAQAGGSLRRDASTRLSNAAYELQRQSKGMEALIGSALKQDEQFKWIAVTGASALVAGLLMSPLLARLLPFGLDARVAAIVMQADRWNAGAALMEAGSPEGWRALEDADVLSKANREALTACRAVAAKERKEQKCTVVVPSVPTSR